jgi:hypothetical protein
MMGEYEETNQAHGGGQKKTRKNRNMKRTKKSKNTTKRK